MSTPICPIMTVRNPAVHELCVGEECALYLPPAKRCSLVYLGYKAMLDIQKIQQGAGPAGAPPQG